MIKKKYTCLDWQEIRKQVYKKYGKAYTASTLRRVYRGELDNEVVDTYLYGVGRPETIHFKGLVEPIRRLTGKVYDHNYLRYVWNGKKENKKLLKIIKKEIGDRK